MTSKRHKALNYLLVALVSLLAVYIVVRKNPPLGRPHYRAHTILVNPAGTCALAEYMFKGGERWSWLDPYALFTLSGGDAFYTVVQIGTGTILRDNTSSILPITAYSQGSAGMGGEVFFWSRDGATAAFPSDDLYHEWTGLRECAGTRRLTEFASVHCHQGDRSPICEKIRGKL